MAMRIPPIIRTRKLSIPERCAWSWIGSMIIIQLSFPQLLSINWNSQLQSRPPKREKPNMHRKWPMKCAIHSLCTRNQCLTFWKWPTWFVEYMRLTALLKDTCTPVGMTTALTHFPYMWNQNKHHHQDPELPCESGLQSKETDQMFT